jgi:hypothetical protein
MAVLRGMVVAGRRNCTRAARPGVTVMMTMMRMAIMFVPSVALIHD